MTLRGYLIIMITATVMLWTGFLLLIMNINPQEAGMAELVIFYAVLVFALTGTGSIIGFLVRFLALKRQLAGYAVVVAFRQAFLTAVLLGAILFLFSQKLFSLFNIGLLIVCLTALEFFLLSYHNEKRTEN